MIYETFDLGISALALQQMSGFIIGLAFGALALLAGFCLRSASVGNIKKDRTQAQFVWFTVFFTALLSSYLAHRLGWIVLSDHRFMTGNVSLFAIASGGLCFGFGAVLTRGCISRLTVLSATGNLRALVVLFVFAIFAHATMKGVLAPLRQSLTAIEISLPVGSLHDISYGREVFLLLLTALGVHVFSKRDVFQAKTVYAVLLGLLIPSAWVITSYLILDPFEPFPAQSVSFTQPWGDALFWTLASTAVPSGFGVQLVFGVLIGSFLIAAMTGRLKLQSFAAPQDLLRYLAGGALMGIGGVLAGGCSVGAGISGASLFSISAFLALGFIILGMRLGARFTKVQNLAPVVVMA